MKKILFASLIGLLAFSAKANATQNAATEVSAYSDYAVYAVYASSTPKVVKRGDRVIIIYRDGTTIIVDKDGSMTVVPNK